MRRRDRRWPSAPVSAPARPPLWRGPAPAHAAAAGPRVLRYAFPVAESGFDPAQISDTYSRTVTAHIFEALYGYDHLARPAKMRAAHGRRHARGQRRLPPLDLQGAARHLLRRRPGLQGPAARADGGRLRLRHQALCRPGGEEPAVGQRRGLAHRRAWPHCAGRRWSSKTPFDYDAPIEGLRVLDRYTLRVALRRCRAPRFIDSMAVERPLRRASRAKWCEAYGDKIAEHPVGTGPFRLAQWRRSSLIVLERNPAYRDACLGRRRRPPTTPRARPSRRSCAAAGCR